MVRRSFTAITDSYSIAKSRARANLLSPRLACIDGDCFFATFKSEVAKSAPALRRMEILSLFVSPRVVGTGKLSDIAGGGNIRELVVWPRRVFFRFCATTGDHWNGDVVSVIGDRVRHEDSTQNAKPTPVLECHWKHSYLHISHWHISVWTAQATGREQIFLGGRHRNDS